MTKYKNGDIVIVKPPKCNGVIEMEKGALAMVSKDNGDGTVLLSLHVRNVEQHDGVRFNAEYILRKVGNIKEVKEDD